MRKRLPSVSVCLIVCGCLIAGAFAGCKQTNFDAPKLGPAAGSATLGGGDTQKIMLLASPQETVATQADDVIVTITALVQNRLEEPMPDDTVIFWTATVGELSENASTTTNGYSEVTLTFPSGFSGYSVVSAMSGDARSSITVYAELSDTFLILQASPDIEADGKTKVKATATTYGQPDVGIAVTFSITSGEDYATLSASSAMTDANGQAAVTLEGQNPSSDEIVVIEATTNDGRTATFNVLVLVP